MKKLNYLWKTLTILFFLFNVSNLANAQLTLTSPNGGENWSVGSVQNITWSLNPGTTNVDILYTTTGSSPYTLIASNIASTGSYSWTVPNTPTTNAKVVIRDSNDPFTIDISNNVFTISTPTLTITSPNGGENWLVGSTQPITWTTTGTISNVTLQYSINGGSTFPYTIANNISNTGSYNWTIPNNPSNQVRVRVRHSSISSISDTSDNNFTIALPPSITVTYPNGGNTLTGGNTYNITWSYTGINSSEQINIYYSDDNALQWNLIGTTNIGASSFSWTTPMINSNQCLVKLELNSDTSINDESNSLFTINTPVPNCATNYSPNNASTNINVNTILSWTSGGGNPSGYDVYFGTTNNPPLVSSNQSGTTYNPGTLNPSTTYYWKIVPKNIIGDATGCPVLSFTTQSLSPTLSLIQPNGGNNLVGGSNYTIQWNYTNMNVGDDLDIYFSSNNGSTWTYVTTTVVDAYSYSWSVPNINSSTCLIALYCPVYSIGDTSNSSFNITQQTLTIINPNGGENLTGNQSYNITWSYTGLGYWDNVTLSYTTNGGATWNNIVTTNAGITSYNWTVPNVTTNQALVRIYKTSQTSINDTSNAFFNINGVPPNCATNFNPVNNATGVALNQTLSWSSGGGSPTGYDVYFGTAPNPPLVSSNQPGTTYNPGILLPNTTYNWRIVPKNANGDATGCFANSFTTANPQITITYPNGGEILNGTSTVNITWTFQQVSNYFSLYYSTNNGSSWNLINSYYYQTSGNGSYSWTVPNVSSTQCLIRIVDSYNTIYNDTSDATFSINGVAPNCAINLNPANNATQVNPNGLSLSWASGGGAPTGYDVYFGTNSNPPIVSNNQTGTSYYAGNLSPNTTYYWKIVPKNSFGSAVGCQTYSFTTGNPSIQIVQPNGGEILTGLSNYQIQWNASLVSNYVNIYYSINNGSTWNTIVTYQYHNNGGTYNWTVPNSPSTQCLIRIVDSYNTSIADTSNANFTINAAPPSITVNNPNGGNTLNVGQNYNITWSAVSVSNVKIEYTYDNGNNWNTIVSSVPSSPSSYLWSVPNTPSTTCKVKISDASNPSVNDESNSNFTINQPIITVLTPNGGENWTGGTNQYIYWQSSGVSNYVKIEYSLNNGGTWTTIVNGANNNGSYYWNVPNTPSNQCLVRVSDYYNNSVNDISNNVFTITQAPPSITVTTPNGGQTWTVNSNQYIYWTSTSVNFVKIEYSIDNGSSWITIANSVNASNGYYLWTVPNTPSQFCLIRISDMSNPSINDQSNSNFYIVNPTIVVTTPNGGETFTALTYNTITWSSSYISNYVTIHYSTNNGLSWNTVVNGAPNSGSYNWLVPNTPSSQCLVRVRDYYNANIFDISDNLFIIDQPAPSIVVTSPNGGEIFGVGSNQNITWTSYSVSNVNIEYSTNGGGTYNTIASNIPASQGSYLWTVPATPSNSCRIRISDASNSSLNDVSNSNFSIVQPIITVTAPNGGQQIQALNNYTITWNSSGISNYVTIKLSIDSGATWSNIVSATYNSGSYNWYVPNTPSTNCYIKVIDYYNSSIFDTSNYVFTILQAPPSIQLLNPNGGQTLAVGSTYNITWNSSSINNVKLEYSINNGSTWSTIANSIPASNGSYAWTIPSTPSQLCLVRISDASNSNYADISDNVFTIANPYITVTTPNGGELYNAGSNTYITWNSLGVSNVKIHYSLDNGATWLIAVNNMVNNGYYYWNVPNVSSNNCLIKVSNSAPNSQLFDESDNTFSIQQPNPSITLTNPNGGENYFVGNSYYITWNSTGVSNIKIEYSTNNGSTWNTIVSSYPASYGYYYWNVPNTVTTQALVKVSSTANSNVNDVSNNTFTISSSQPQIVVTSPNGNETWYVGSYHHITWSSNNVNLVKIEYSINGGSSWILLANNYSGNSYYWNVPNTPSLNCLVKVTAIGNNSVNDQSNSVFEIAVPASNSNTISIDSLVPSSPLVYCKGDTIQVYFASSGTFNSSNTFTAQLSDSNGVFTNPIAIGSIVSNTVGSNVISATIPAYVPNASSYRIRVVASDLPTIGTDNGVDIKLTGPQFNFAADATVKYLPNGNTQFTYLGSTANIQSYLWDFGDGNNSSVTNPSHFYSNIGYYNVQLTVTDSTGCSVTEFKPNYMRIERLFNNVDIAPGTNTTITSVNFLNDTLGIVSLSNGNVYITYNSGTSWTYSITGLSVPLNATYILNGYWYIVGNNGTICISTNSGQTWTPFYTGTSEAFNGVSFVNNNNGYAVGTNGTICYYNGTSWTPQVSNTSNNLNGVYNIGTSAVAVGDNSVILIGNSGNWTSISSPVSSDFKAVAFATSTKGYAVGTNGVIISTNDGGQTWTPSLTGVDVDFSSVTTNNNDTAWAVANNGIIYITPDGGNTWERYSIGSEDNLKGVNYPKANNSTNRGYVVGDGGVARLFGNNPADTTGSGTSGGNSIFEHLSVRNMFKVYPNPASNYLNIETYSDTETKIQIQVKDINGKPIEIITDEFNGNYNKQINVSNLSNGIYFLHFEQGNKYWVQKVIVAR